LYFLILVFRPLGLSLSQCELCSESTFVIALAITQTGREGERDRQR
jgi:hypothetical protein